MKFTITLETPKYMRDSSAEAMLRLFLKEALRTYGLRCVECREVTQEKTIDARGQASIEV